MFLNRISVGFILINEVLCVYFIGVVGCLPSTLRLLAEWMDSCNAFQHPSDKYITRWSHKVISTI